MKTFVKILVAIIVVAAICGGVYLVLPEMGLPPLTCLKELILMLQDLMCGK